MKRLFLSLSAVALLAACEQNSPVEFQSAKTAPEFAAVAATVSTDKNPTCTSLGYDFGFKVDSRADFNGTYPVVINGVTIGSVTVTTADQTYFGWTSTFGVDAVISKGGTNGNIYAYAGESYGDTKLNSPIVKSGKPAAISHIDFCFDFELAASKTASTSYTRTYDWTITKAASTDALTLAKNATGTIGYTVAVTKDAGTDSDWAVAGTITLSNPTPFPAIITSVTDVLSNDAALAVECPRELPITLAAGESVACSYASPLASAQPLVNTASATTDAATFSVNSEANGLKVYGSGAVKGASATASVTFGAPSNEINESITVADAFNGGAIAALGSTSASHTYSYSKSVSYDACGSQTVANTASFASDDSDLSKSASASVAVTVNGCTTVIDNPPPPPPVTYAHETAFAFGGAAAKTFTSISGTNRWGWSNGPLSEGTYTWNLYAGAGQNNISNATLVGTATVVYANGKVTVTYSMLQGMVLTGTHVYAGSAPMATDNGEYTTAPGQFTSTGFSTTHEISGLSGSIYVVIHAAVDVPQS